MKISAEHEAGVLILLPEVESLDADNAKEFRKAVETYLQTDQKIVFDMGRITFIDSSGLGAMLSCLRKVNGGGGVMRLCSMSKGVHSLFELVRMHRIFEIFNTRPEALLSFQD